MVRLCITSALLVAFWLCPALAQEPPREKADPRAASPIYSPSTKRSPAQKPQLPNGRPDAVGLNAPECRGLGGTVGGGDVFRDGCLLVCSLTDNHGVIRRTCLTSITD